MELTFFHWSRTYIETFSPQIPKRPVFYWCSDRFHHLYDKNESEDYFYLFVKNPKKDGIEMMTRELPSSFDTLYKSYMSYRDRLLDFPSKYSEPPILLSFSQIEPDLVAKPIGPNMTYEIIKCDNQSLVGQQFSFLDEKGNKIPFEQIDILCEAVPSLLNSVPIKKIVVNIEYTYKNWNPIKGIKDDVSWI